MKIDRETAETICMMAITGTLCLFGLMLAVPLTVGFFVPSIDNKELFPIAKDAQPYITGGLLALLGQWLGRSRKEP